MTQSELEIKYSLQQWRELMLAKVKQDMFPYIHDWLDMIVLLIHHYDGSFHSKRWDKVYPTYEWLAEVFTCIMEGSIKACKYTTYVPINAFVRGLYTITKQHNPLLTEDEVYKVALDLVAILGNTEMNGKIVHLWTIENSPHSEELVIVPNKGILKEFFKDEFGLLNRFKTPLPMIEKPLSHTPSQAGGYYHFTYPISKARYKRQEDEWGTSLMALNHLQECEWKLNWSVIDQFDINNHVTKGKDFTEKSRTKTNVRYLNSYELLKDVPLHIPPSMDECGRIYNKVANQFDYHAESYRRCLYKAAKPIQVAVEANNYLK